MEQVAGSTSADLVKGAILISPFFFWGTSMVAMKASLEQQTPQLSSQPACILCVGHFCIQICLLACPVVTVSDGYDITAHACRSLAPTQHPCL